MLNLDNMIPVAFWPYTSIVLDRVFSINYQTGDCLDKLCTDLVLMFQNEEIPAHNDNKIVFEFLNTETDKSMYIGFKDWTCSMGYAMRTDEYNKTAQRIEARTERLARFL